MGINIMDMDNSTIPPEKSPEDLTKEDRSQLEEIKKHLDRIDDSAVTQYGIDIQNKISAFADTMLSRVRAGDTGHVGVILTDLMNKLKEIRIDSLPDKKGSLFSRLPLIGALLDGAKSFLARSQSISSQIVQIVDELEKVKTQLLRDVEMLDHFYENNVEYFQLVGLYIKAGEMKLNDLRANVLPELEENAGRSNNALELQRYRDMMQTAARLEKRVHDLKLSRTVSLQTGPQIRLIQNNNRELAEKIQRSILNTIPLWKHQMVIAITLMRQSQLGGIQKDISRTTKEILEKNAEMLKVSSAEIVSESEKGIVDIETLKKVNADLISTIEETLRLQREGRIRREEAERELAKIESELKEKLAGIRNAARKDAG